MLLASNSSRFVVCVKFIVENSLFATLRYFNFDIPTNDGSVQAPKEDAELFFSDKYSRSPFIIYICPAPSSLLLSSTSFFNPEREEKVDDSPPKYVMLLFARSSSFKLDNLFNPLTSDTPALVHSNFVIDCNCASVKLVL